MKIYYNGKKFTVLKDGEEKLFKEVYPDKNIKKEATEIEIKYGTKIINSSAFKSFTNIKDIIIPNSVTEIKEFAFKNCSSLENITIGDDVASIGTEAFYDCKSLKNVNMSKSLNKMGNGVFRNCTSLTSLIFPNNDIEIGEQCFSDCINLENITLSNKTTIIPANMFRDCKSLKEIFLPYTLEEIGPFAFAGCKNLKEINIPKSVSKIDYYAFQSCELIKNVSLCNIKEISDGTFGLCKSLETVILPPNLISINHSSFYECTALKNINIHDNIKIINVDAFDGCEKIEPKTYERIKNLCIYNAQEDNVEKFLKIFKVDKYDSEKMQELMAMNPVFYKEANRIDREVFLDEVLKSIKKVESEEYGKIKVIQTELCNILYDKTSTSYLYLNSNSYKILDENDLEKIDKAIVKFEKEIENNKEGNDESR